MKKNLNSTFSNRQYMNSKNFELFYYSDSTLAPVKEHTHDYYEFYFFLEGDMEIHIDGRAHRMRPHDFYLVRPNTPHYPTMISQDKPYRRFVLWIAKEYYEDLMNHSASYRFLCDSIEQTGNCFFSNEPITFNYIQSLLFQIIEATRSDRFGSEVESYLQLNSLILYLNRIVYEKSIKRLPDKEKDTYLALCQYVDEHIDENLTLDNIADAFFLSKYYVSHLFKEKTGISLYQYIIKKRLHICRNAILNGDCISKVCMQYGFHDYTSFFRAFKKEYGISPNEYKKSCKETLEAYVRKS